MLTRPHQQATSMTLAILRYQRQQSLHQTSKESVYRPSSGIKLSTSSITLLLAHLMRLLALLSRVDTVFFRDLALAIAHCGVTHSRFSLQVLLTTSSCQLAPSLQISTETVTSSCSILMMKPSHNQTKSFSEACSFSSTSTIGLTTIILRPQLPLITCKSHRQILLLDLTLETLLTLKAAILSSVCKAQLKVSRLSMTILG